MNENQEPAASNGGTMPTATTTNPTTTQPAPQPASSTGAAWPTIAQEGILAALFLGLVWLGHADLAQSLIASGGGVALLGVRAWLKLP
jgi:hypothetical protein